jgi:uncharacterized protein (DUF362 family)
MDTHTEKLNGTLSRREFIQNMVVGGTVVFIHLLNGCQKNVPQTVVSTPEPTPFSIETAAPTPVLTDTPTVPTPTPQPTFTPSPIPDDDLFDVSKLSQVFVASEPDCSGYPDLPPFHPDTDYPEYPYDRSAISAQNDVYRLVRQAFRLVNPDGYGESAWNPLGHIIKPGNCVLIKPNLVDASEWQNGQMTHPSMLRPIIDYVYKACGPQGSIIVGDAPWSVNVFSPLVEETGIQTLIDWLANYTGVPIQLADLNSSEPQLTPLVDLGDISELHGLSRTWFDGHGRPMLIDGKPGVGPYRISPYVLEADVVVTVPKAKVHCSGGITAAMKNAIGIIPAWDGPYGDGYLKDCAHTSNIDQAAGDRGMYLDNDTIWRTIADLNRIMRYADKHGNIHNTPQRRIFHIVDAICAAEASQYNPVPFPLKTVIMSSDPIAIDAVTARCMGFDSRRLKSVVSASHNSYLPLGNSLPAEIKVHTPDAGLSALFRQALQPELYVYSWKGHLETDDFDAPEIVAWSMPQKDKLEIHVCDASSVSWVRVEYTYGEKHKMKNLAIVEGDHKDGLWKTDFPHGAYISQMNVTAGDALFNEVTRTYEL